MELKYLSKKENLKDIFDIIQRNTFNYIQKNRLCIL